MTMNDDQPQADDWVVDIEIDGVLESNRFWGQADELAELLWENVRLLGGTPTSTNIPELIDQLNGLETDRRRRYVVTQEPRLVRIRL